MLIAILLSGCGAAGRAPAGSLAELSPAGTDIYVEAVLEPDFDAREAINSVTERFPRGRMIEAEIADEVDERLAAVAGPNRPLGFGRDIEPWLGDRFSFSADGLEAGRPRFSLVLETSDPEAAAAAIERLAASSADPADQREGELGAVYELDSGLARVGRVQVGVVGERVVIASDPRRFDAVAALEEAEEPRSLASRDDFSYAVGTAEGSSAIVFSWLDSTDALDAAAERLGEPDLARRLDAFVRQSGIDGKEPASFALGLTADVVLFDTSIALLDRAEPDPEADELLLGSLPLQSIFAAACSSCLETAVSGDTADAALGMLIDPRDRAAVDQIRSRLSGLGRGLGPAAAFVYAESPVSLAGGIVVEVREPVAVGGELAELRRRTATLDGARVSGVRLPRDTRAQGFEVRFRGEDESYIVAANDTRLVLARGRAAAALALAPRVTLGDVRAFADFSDQLGDEFSPSALLDVARIRGLLGPSRDPDVQRMLRTIDEINRVGVGVRVAEGRLITRLIVGLEGFD
ncbi:hypothetical protein HJD18_00215 [Thermoleophilia bacterium SCSIO 60948]|nr:hypothetical protein HJD18_00215 [Thermoleophilia bacterium SCSIO 60948]